MEIHESGENYLEAIYILENKLGSVRSIDVANHLGFSKPSISRAMGILKKSGYIIIDENGIIKFTELGRETAEKVFTRHTILCDFLMSIGVSAETADTDACRIEHVISEETFEAIKVKTGR